MFICSYAVVDLQIKNQGDDAFKPDLYGDVIRIERRISETTSSLVLKNHQGFPIHASFMLSEFLLAGIACLFIFQK